MWRVTIVVGFTTQQQSPARHPRGLHVKKAAVFSHVTTTLARQEHGGISHVLEDTLE